MSKQAICIIFRAEQAEMLKRHGCIQEHCPTKHQIKKKHRMFLQMWCSFIAFCLRWFIVTSCVITMIRESSNGFCVVTLCSHNKAKWSHQISRLVLVILCHLLMYSVEFFRHFWNTTQLINSDLVVYHTVAWFWLLMGKYTECHMIYHIKWTFGGWIFISDWVSWSFRKLKLVQEK